MFMINNVSNYLVLLVPFLLFNSVINAQSSFVNAGGDITNSSGSISYSIGQLFTSAVSNESGEFNEGVQQISSIRATSIIENEFNNLSVFPNPTKDIIHIKTSSLSGVSDYFISITDLLGKILHTEKIHENETTINLNQLGEHGIYLINFYNSTQEVMTTKRILFID